MRCDAVSASSARARRTTWLALILAALLTPDRSLGSESPREVAAARYEVDGQHSTVGFTIRILGVAKVRGRFRDYASTIVYDPAHTERSSVTAIIKATSITTDMDFRDEHLRTPDFFDVAQFPTIQFQSDRVERRNGTLVVTGRFTMRGITRTISLPITVLTAKPDTVPGTGSVRVAFEADVRINRKDYGIAGTNRFNPGYNPLTTVLSDSVDINLELFASRTGYLNRVFAGQKPPSIADTVGRVLALQGLAEAIPTYRAIRADTLNAHAYNFSPGQLNNLGLQLMQRGRLDDAIGILALNEQWNGSINGVPQSLGEAFMWANRADDAAAAFRRALQIDSLETSAIEMLRRLPAARGPR